MQEKHEWLRWISTCYIVEVDAIGSDILVFPQGSIKQAVWRF